MASHIFFRERRLGNFFQSKPGKVVKKSSIPVTMGIPRKVLGDITSEQNIIKPSLDDKTGGMTKPLAEESKIVEEIQVEETTTGCLPPGVVDIDSGDYHEPQLNAEYAVQTFAYLREVEALHLVGERHWQNYPTNTKMRAVLVDWMISVQTQFKLLPETIYAAVDILDRFMSIDGANLERHKLQLTGCAAMWLASKIEETYAPACSDFVFMSGKAFTRDELIAQELKIAKTLEFALSNPTPITFLRRFSKAGAGCVEVTGHCLAKYTLELTLLEDTLVAVPGSKLAAASLCLSILILEEDGRRVKVQDGWTPTLAYYSGYTTSDLEPLVSKLASHMVKTYTKGVKLRAVRDKYRSRLYHRVADLAQHKMEVYQNIANWSRN